MINICSVVVNLSPLINIYSVVVNLSPLINICSVVVNLSPLINICSVVVNLSTCMSHDNQVDVVVAQESKVINMSAQEEGKHFFIFCRTHLLNPSLSTSIATATTVNMRLQSTL